MGCTLTGADSVVSNPDRDDREQGGVCTLGAVDTKNARNQVVFREVNEHIAALSGAGAQTSVSLFICECSDPECAEALEVTLAEYERVRADGARFVVCAGHQIAEIERVVGGNGRFLVVEKIGPAGTIARTADPRHHA
jgi:hypothetical protein